MTKENLLKKARFFGAHIGDEFELDNLPVICKGSIMIGDNAELYFQGDTMTSGAITTIVLPDEKDKLDNILLLN